MYHVVCFQLTKHNKLFGSYAFRTKYPRTMQYKTWKWPALQMGLPHHVTPTNIDAHCPVCYTFELLFTGYSNAVRFLDGEDMANDTYYHQLIELFAEQLVHCIPTLEVLPSMLSRELMTYENAEAVRAAFFNHGREVANWDLLFRLNHGQHDWFYTFMVVLVDHNLEVAHDLEPDLFKSKFS